MLLAGLVNFEIPIPYFN